LVDYDVILRCTLPLKCQNSTFASIAESVYCRLIKMVPNDSPTQVSYPHLINCFALTPSQTDLLTKNDFCATTSSLRVYTGNYTLLIVLSYEDSSRIFNLHERTSSFCQFRFFSIFKNYNFFMAHSYPQQQSFLVATRLIQSCQVLKLSSSICDIFQISRQPR